MTRAELIEQYFLDPVANPGPPPLKIRFAAQFANMKEGDQNTVLQGWADARGLELKNEAAAIQAQADATDALADDIVASKP